VPSGAVAGVQATPKVGAVCGAVQALAETRPLMQIEGLPREAAWDSRRDACMKSAFKGVVEAAQAQTVAGNRQGHAFLIHLRHRTPAYSGPGPQRFPCGGLARYRGVSHLFSPLQLRTAAQHSSSRSTGSKTRDHTGTLEAFGRSAQAPRLPSPARRGQRPGRACTRPFRSCQQTPHPGGSALPTSKSQCW